MMKKQYVISAIVLLSVVAVNAADRKLTFIDANFDDFTQRVTTNEQERAQFKVYYANLAQKIQEAKEGDQQKERATYRYLHKLALTELEKKHADWYQEIMPFVSDPRLTLDEQLEDVRKIIKFFLTRYGAYEEFQNFKAVKGQQAAEVDATLAQNSKGGFWDSVKSLGNKVASLFGFGKAQEQHVA
ncbi:MAG: hypothetical protein NTX86_01865 [Candidatus Dependentiae bacterium]|nr:hypothetical protein [Candidatus Dependentiae bacterium]